MGILRWLRLTPADKKPAMGESVATEPKKAKKSSAEKRLIQEAVDNQKRKNEAIEAVIGNQTPLTRKQRLFKALNNIFGYRNDSQPRQDRKDWWG